MEVSVVMRRAKQNDRRKGMVSDGILTIRRLGRWQTLRLLCWIGRADLALELAIQMLTEQISRRDQS
jgi:hypothetical protein